VSILRAGGFHAEEQLQTERLDLKEVNLCLSFFQLHSIHSRGARKSGSFFKEGVDMALPVNSRAET